tara:strand:- start:11359 stop:12180 length:822 start_codon:yes stop_codon:yes gene_type:complete
MDLFPLTFPAIDPVLVEIGPLAIRWYGLAYFVGILAGWRYAVYLGRLYGGRPISSDVESLVLWVTFGIILGGRLGYVLFYQWAAYLQDPLSILEVWHGGMSFHGGLLGVTAAIVIFAWKRELPLLKLTDIVAPVVPIGLFFGRLANFINGELWGRVSDAPWAIVFPGAGDLPRHPSQLYEAFLEGLVLFVVLAVLAHKPSIRRRPGMITGVFLLGYGLSRIAAEFFREPDAFLGFLFGGLTMGQILSLPMVLLGILLVLWGRIRHLASRGATR